MNYVKIGGKKNSLDREVLALRSFRSGVVEVIDYQPEHSRLVLERIEPGTTLAELVREGKDELATQIIAKTLLTLQANFDSRALQSLPHLSTLRKDVSILKGQIENSLYDKFEKLFFEWTEPRATDVVLHGDLHHDNILKRGDDWIAIDPHGYVGDPAYDIGAMIYNPFFIFESTKDFKPMIHSRLKILEKETNFGSRRILDWAFCKCLLSAAWELQDGGDLPQRRVDVAQFIIQI